MDIKLKFAETAEEMDSLFHTRHQVFVEQEGYMRSVPDRKLTDRFDSLPTTKNVVAKVRDRIVGGARFTAASSLGSPTDDWTFDFSPYVHSGKNNVGVFSMLCVARECRGFGLANRMMSLGRDWAESNRWSHVLSLVNPVITSVLSKGGYRPIASKRYDKRHKLHFVPMVLDICSCLMTAH